MRHPRRRADSNRRIKVLQTSPLPLGYGADQFPSLTLPRLEHVQIKTKPRHLVGWGRRGSLKQRCIMKIPPYPAVRDKRNQGNP